MASSDILFLSSPLPSQALQLGALLSDPFVPKAETFSSSTYSLQSLEDKYVESSYKDTIIRRGESPEAEDTVSVEAEEMTYRHLRQVTKAFESLCKDPETLSYFTRKANGERPLYFVTGVQELRNASVIPASPEASTVANAGQTTKLPTHVRRDSGMDATQSAAEEIFGIEVRKVRARLGRPDEPHQLEDIDYQWSYISLEDDVQLSIGLGEVLSFREPSESEAYDSDDSDEEMGYIIEL